ncbi:alpha-galactosidase [Ilumatobacter sp.]|uniref:alpha-galactosidase n=1 Tax=Ilumatobacter sp. TaxID=1967498 RepID=UPI003C62341D
MSSLVRLSKQYRSEAVDVVVDVSTGAPTIVFWGRSLGEGAEIDAIVSALDRPLVHGTFDTVAPISVVPEHGSGFVGRPGLVGRRGGGRAWAPRFATVGSEVRGDTLIVDAVDEIAELRLRTTISLGHTLRVAAEVTNTAARRYSLDALTVTLPIAQHIDELLTFDGRWSREFHPVRRDWRRGDVLIENRRGRTSHESPPLFFAGESGFGEWTGDVYGVHVAWSGNHTILANRLPDGRRYVQAGELLHPGEVVLEPGESYRTPDLHGVHSTGGLTPATWQFHEAVRSFDVHPSSPRPVSLNTWEAVYFDHDTERLKGLADAAAALGIERFVLDDGWFGSRRDDTRGLGDWWVSDAVYPDGLDPLISHVTGLGMEFGIWVEPEMVNPDSVVHRAHPEWALVTEGYEPVLGRHQLVLDLANPDAFDFIEGHLDALLRDHDIAYVKWDMNRDHIQASGDDGASGSRAQTLAFYRLVDTLRSKHPTVEIESCSSGGARIDLEVLRRAERVWTSDCNDALERQTIQRGASMLIPPEVMGAHIGPRRSHTTARTQSLAFRAATALFGHLGVEWDVTQLTDRERTALRAMIGLYKEHRDLLHGGDTVRFSTEDAYNAHGVYARDRSRAVVSFAQLTTAASQIPPPLRLPGLDPDATYRIEHLAIPFGPPLVGRTQPSWMSTGVTLTGRQLETHGIQPPTLHPESAVLFLITRTD